MILHTQNVKMTLMSHCEVVVTMYFLYFREKLNLQCMCKWMSVRMHIAISCVWSLINIPYLTVNTSNMDGMQTCELSAKKPPAIKKYRGNIWKYQYFDGSGLVFSNICRPHLAKQVFTHVAVNQTEDDGVFGEVIPIKGQGTLFATHCTVIRFRLQRYAFLQLLGYRCSMHYSNHVLKKNNSSRKSSCTYIIGCMLW